MITDYISGKNLSKEELMLLLNESSIIVVIESGGRIICANRFFFEITGCMPRKAETLSLSSFLSGDTAAEADEIKNRILENIRKGQTIRSEDKRLSVELLTGNGRDLPCVMEIVLLSDSPEEKWGYKLIEEIGFQPEQKQIRTMEKLKGALLNLSQSLIRLNDIQSFFELVLEAADTTITNGDYCTILKYVDDDKFIPVATRGYNWNILADFVLPLEDSFSWLELGHLIDRTIIIENIDQLYKRSRKMIEVEGYSIKSSIQTPIFLNNELFGLLTIDSRRERAFNEIDFNTIEYLRTQIQIALENQLLYSRMQHRASHDQLTDVISRGTFEERVIKFLRNKYHYESCCIIMMDLNDLKVVNDVWGHAAGDKYLIEFISVMKQHMRGSDLLARLGGDEFAICFFSSQSAQFIERLEEIQQHFINHPLKFRDTLVSCWFSYGIAHCPEDGEIYDVLINTADSRMYEMKSGLKRKKQTNDLREYRR